jgi:hypothetical protein
MTGLCLNCGVKVMGRRKACSDSCRTELARKRKREYAAKRRTSGAQTPVQRPVVTAATPVVPDGPLDLDDWLAEWDARPTWHEYPTFTGVDSHGHKLADVLAFLVQREGWEPNADTPPPSPYFLPASLVPEFTEWSAR